MHGFLAFIVLAVPVVVFADGFVGNQHFGLDFPAQKPHPQDLALDFLFDGFEGTALLRQFAQIGVHGQVVFGERVLKHGHDLFFRDSGERSARFFRFLFDEHLIDHALQQGRPVLLQNFLGIGALVVFLDVHGVRFESPVELRKRDHLVVDDGDDAVRHFGVKRCRRKHYD